MTPSLARALYDDPQWCARKAPAAVKALLRLSGDQEPRGLLRDLLRFVVSLEGVQAALDRHRAEVSEVVGELQDKAEAGDDVIAELAATEKRLHTALAQLQKKVRALESQIAKKEARIGELVVERDRALMKVRMLEPEAEG